MLRLGELAADDPRLIWREERKQGLVAGIDEVFHFVFDDHDFDEADVGLVFTNSAEVAAVVTVKRALNAVLEAVGDAGDDEFVQHPLWRDVTRAAVNAKAQLTAAS
jgi:hypothetical protein